MIRECRGLLERRANPRPFSAEPLLENVEGTCPEERGDDRGSPSLPRKEQTSLPRKEQTCACLVGENKSKRKPRRPEKSLTYIDTDDRHHDQVGLELRAPAARVLRRIPGIHAGVFRAGKPGGYQAPGTADEVNRSRPDGVVDVAPDEPAVRDVVQQRRNEGYKNSPGVPHRGAACASSRMHEDWGGEEATKGSD